MNIFEAERLLGQLDAAAAPKRTIDKVERWIADSAAVQAAVQAASEQWREAVAAFSDLEIRIRHSWGAVRDGDKLVPAGSERWSEDSDSAKMFARDLASLDRARAHRDRLRLAKERAEEGLTFGWLSDLSRWLADYRRRGINVSKIAKLDIRKGETLVDALDRVRGEISQVEAEIDAVEGAPVALAELLARMDAEIDSVADHHAHTVWTRTDGAPIHLTTDGATNLGAMFWLLRDELKARARTLVSTAHPGDGLPTDKRATEIKRLHVSKLDLERVEEAIASAIEDQGGTVIRRRDANPLALLEVAE